MATSADAAERTVIESYLEEHGLEVALNDVVNEVVKVRPPDPYLHMAAAIRGASETANTITGVESREVLNCRGMPALEVEVMTQQGSFRASTSIGPFDGDKGRYSGLGLRQAAEAVRMVLADRVVGMDVLDQEAVDKVLASVDAPANSVLAASVAVCRAGAKHSNAAVYEHVAALAGTSAALPMPHVSVLNGGAYGRGATTLVFEDISVMPMKAATFEEALEACGDVVRCLPAVCADHGVKVHHVGDFGGYTLDQATPKEALRYVHEACKRAREDPDFFVLGVDVNAPAFAVPPPPVVPDEEDDDEAATSAVEKKTAEVEFRYDFDKLCPEAPAPTEASKKVPAAKGDKKKKELEAAPTVRPKMTVDETHELFVELLATFPVATLEDAFHCEDAKSLSKLRARLDQEILRDDVGDGAAAAGEGDGAAPAADKAATEEDPRLPTLPVGGDESCTLQLAADVLCATAEDIDTFDEAKTQNTLVLTLRKGKTVSGGVDLAATARAAGWGLIIAAETRDGETEDAFVAAFAVGLRAGQFKAGGLMNVQHLAKYNEIARIASPTALLGAKEPPLFIGKNFRNVDAPPRED